ncbi:EAL domain-containing protein [Pleurocapsales cyanobacterium LEGE 10410]|nr:EAL domain-containing protein [Pleurocapsales cyanobacterium LEGE 10410]
MDSSDLVHHILVIEDPAFVREIHLNAATYSLGRHSSNDIVFSCQKTSRNHATLLRRTDVKTNLCSYWILDGDLQGNRSRNGIYINGKKSLVHELKPGDVVQFSADAIAKYKITSELPNNVIESKDLVDNLPKVRDTAVNKETVVSLNENPRNKSKRLESQQTALTELSPQPIIEIDLYGNITYINSAGIVNFKDIHHQKLSHPILKNLITQNDAARDSLTVREVQVDNKTFRQTAHRLPEKKVIRSYIVDISNEKTLARELQQNKLLYDQIVQQITEGIIIVELATKQIIEVNSAISNLLGYSAAEMLQMNVYEIMAESDKFATILRRVVADKNSFWGECFLRHRNSKPIGVKLKIDLIGSESEKICLVVHRLKNNYSSESLQYSAVGWSKKEIFNRQLLTAIANAKRSQKLLAVMFCKLSFLPDIRAAIGTKKSEQLLSTLGERLNACLRAGDTVIHWQDDKFALLLPQISGIEEVAKINQRIQESIEQSFTLGDTQVTTQSKIGVAIYPQDGTDVEILSASANTALERAGKNQDSFQFYDETMNSQALVTLELENLLQQALNREEFKLHYQPQINVSTGEIEAIEALLRWESPELGLVAPGNFIKSAERTKLIVPIGEWAIRSACIQHQKWQSQGLPPLKIRVSISSVQFQQPNLPQKVAEILAEVEIDSRFLELEIGAVSLMENIDYSRHLINQLKTVGVGLAVDGFTTGFSAIEYLKHFSLNTLKIDRFLVQQMTDSPQDLAIVAALIELGKGFNLKVIAEGVETKEQVELLRSLNCHNMQGFWFGRPLAADEASKLLRLNDLEEATQELLEMPEEELAEEQ